MSMCVCRPLEYLTEFKIVHVKVKANCDALHSRMENDRESFCLNLVFSNRNI